MVFSKVQVFDVEGLKVWRTDERDKWLLVGPYWLEKLWGDGVCAVSLEWECGVGFGLYPLFENLKRFKPTAEAWIKGNNSCKYIRSTSTIACNYPYYSLQCGYFFIRKSPCSNFRFLWIPLPLQLSQIYRLGAVNIRVSATKCAVDWASTLEHRLIQSWGLIENSQSAHQRCCRETKYLYSASVSSSRGVIISRQRRRNDSGRWRLFIGRSDGEKLE